MNELVFPPPEITTLLVANRSSVFPVGRVFCVGRNYRWGADSAPRAPDMPPWFMKPASAVVPAQGVLPYPPGTSDFCHEIELVVAIGRQGRSLDAVTVESTHIWGYGAGLDLTRRDLQHQAKLVGGPWEAAKAFDYSAPCTPLVSVADCGHPRTGSVWLSVNGIERQKADLSELIWSVPELVAMLSRSVTLMPGDLIFTGTPTGVGSMKAHDVITGGVEGIGQFSLTIGELPSVKFPPLIKP